MADFGFTCDWLLAQDKDLESAYTTGFLGLKVAGVNLLENEDIWSKTIRPTALLSAYPLAMWLATSWWRLNSEPLHIADSPDIDWRMAHEMGAANSGFVWPQVIFASDGNAMQMWAVPSGAKTDQSVRYLNGLELPATVSLKEFERETSNFIASVLSRLDALGRPDTDLHQLWRLIQEDRANPDLLRWRKLEARMGYDPDECPETLKSLALDLEKELGSETLSELAPIYGKTERHPLKGIRELKSASGISGKPKLPVVQIATSASQELAWQPAVRDARRIREALGNPNNKINNELLCTLLGMRAAEVDEWTPPKHAPAGIAVTSDNENYKFIPRKKHPLSKRFELARFVADVVNVGRQSSKWLASTDLSTYRQKYQRAFAAEFLCPIRALKDFLDGDYSQSATADAAHHFQVSQEAIYSLLANNGIIPPHFALSEYRLPYLLHAA